MDCVGISISVGSGIVGGMRRRGSGRENRARWKWDVLDCAFDNDIISVQVNASAGRERFGNWISAVSEGTADESTIKVNMLGYIMIGR